MAKVDGSLKALLQGVSQQPPRDRLAGQCTEMINMTADPVAGLSRRAPTDLVGALGVSSDVRGFHNFEMRDGGKYLAFFRDGGVRVTDYNAVEFPVTVEPSAAPYLQIVGDLACTTVEDQVIVANKSVVTAMTNERRQFYNAPRGVRGKATLIHVRGGAYGREYKIFRNGAEIAMYRPPSGTNANQVGATRTDHIANRLYEALTQGGGEIPDIDGEGSSTRRYGSTVGPNWGVARFADVILIVRANDSNDDYRITVSDDNGGVNMKVIQDYASGTEDLPYIAPHGYLVRIAKETDPEDDVLLEFIVDGIEPGTNIGSSFGLPGYWQETVAANVAVAFNRATMPHILEYNPTNRSFVFRQGNWANRKVGTEQSNPRPSFIGNTINDVGSFQGRLVFLAGSFVCMGRTNRFDDFWMGSASQLVDTDPIDISSTAVEASVMRAVVPNNRDLVIFSQRGQFLVFGRSVLTPQNAALVLTTTFEAELRAKPTASGPYVFFATTYGRFTGVREFYSEGTTDANDARLITQHVKEYLMGRAYRMISSSNYDMVLVQTDRSRQDVYVYQYIWSSNEKIQSAWSKWTLPFEVIYSYFDEEMVYFVMRETTSAGVEHFLVRMSLDIYAEEQVDYPIFLDERFDVHDVYTAFVLPFNRLSTAELVAVQGDGCPNPGLTVPIQSVTFDAANNRYIATLRYDMRGGDIVVGRRYYSEYRPTMPMIKDQDNVVVGTGKFRIKQFLLTLSNTGHIIGQLLSKYGDGEPVEFQGRLIGSPDNLIGQAATVDETFEMPFRESPMRADVRFSTDRWLPMTILDIEWLGQYSKSGKRISTGG
ncbi:tail protein [Agrobacterium phage Atu_ph02]|uniref:Tail fibers protein n=1 Tax=Agrobacterium phage Atu_ph02 TaxID=2024261 RepID=A0A223VZU1_9CAUD|nr:tail protein [Agrobacterium phage Atu_ph02]ASV44569.1 tail fibers protein [Agrobacterium phage Atu_ph02]